MSIPVLLSPIQFTYPATRDRARVGANNNLDAERPRSQTTTDEEEETREDSESDDDSEMEGWIAEQKRQMEAWYFNEAETYPMDYDIRSRVREDIKQLSEDFWPVKLEATLSFWEKASIHAEPFLIHVMDEKYAKEPLAIDILQEDDRALATAVQTACRKTGFVLLLGHLELKRHGAVYDIDDLGSKATASGLRYYNEEDLRSRHYIEELLEESWQLTRVYDTDGHVVTGQIKINKDNIVEETPWGGFYNPNKLVYPAGYDEYYGDLVTHYYDAAVMIIVPRANLLDFLDVDPGWADIEADSKQANLYTSIHYFITKMRKSPDPTYRISFVSSCMKIIDYNKKMSLRDRIPSWFCPALLVGAIHMQDARLCKRIVDAFGPQLKVRSWEPFEYWISDATLFWDLLNPRRPIQTIKDLNAFVDELRCVCLWDPVSAFHFDASETGQTLEDLEDFMRERAATRATTGTIFRGKKRGAEESADDSRLAKRTNRY
ncbi:hypothetical protein PtrSN002B_006615 [Pyrenophora tritici-repentis]|uniref:Uncharacterized protein n=1 Tax=Pyrenophora tritici-repentis TaxID=45151 RepID=A0A2W1DQF3_9PLEO|nr:hypothetical protein PtrV1_13799 [Pyrenophora tritici-repentis]KAF7447178.1 hypothetical protein A1F99_086250 [Pyrenophora tritici-repentis]KAF7569523.1 hypothetical protein PtrM4_119380 [Pyrenophora tritici-repentis]KAG9382725.1 hypothetical protein A1F94_006646 [Pyrenophora tritici-repentis]KAI0570987.1 hypothetical protein Alg215_10697 [Pyrenophora tritici-repentis]